MIITALAKYYDCLQEMENSPLVPSGYSKINISYALCLTKEGEFVQLIPRFKTVKFKDKFKEVPTDEIFPERVSFPGVVANFLEHRAKYIFGLNVNSDNELVVDENAKKSFACFLDKTEILGGIESPIAKAIYNFSKKWVPSEETNNPLLLQIIKEYTTAKFNYCLIDDITAFANKDKPILEKWEQMFSNTTTDNESGFCAVQGDYLPIARIHDNLRGVKGGLATGNNIVCCKENSGESYCKTQGSVASISEKIMKKYTSAFNYLTMSRKNSHTLGDMTLLFWAETATNPEAYEEAFAYFNGFTFDRDGDMSEKLEKLCISVFTRKTSRF